MLKRIPNTIHCYRDECFSCVEHKRARKNGADGLYCWQTVGYYGDNYSSEQFICIECDKHLYLPLEF